MAHTLVHVKNAALQAIDILGTTHASPNWTAIATQFIKEKGWNWWDNPTDPYNVGNCKVDENGTFVFAKPSSMLAGIKLYTDTLENTSFDNGKTLVYQNVLDAIKNDSPKKVLEALHNSPYCDPPYNLDELKNILGQVESMENPTQAVSSKQKEITDLENAISSLNSELDTKKKELEGLQSQAATPTTSNEEFVTVTKNPPDSTLWGIAANHLGSGPRWADIMRLNPGINPARLVEGQKVRIK